MVYWCSRCLTAVRCASVTRTTLAATLSDWVDIDVAAHALARALGVMPINSAMSDAKWVYWSNNPLGNELVILLDRLVELGFLEKRDEPDIQYRTQPDFPRTLDILDLWAKPPSPSLDLLVLRCSNLEASKVFYESLGLSLKPEQHGSGPPHYSTLLGETVLELYPATTPAPTVRLGVSVPQLEKALAAVTALGDFVLSSELEGTPARALVRDPDGNKVELIAARR
jgi:catechol 2,3-dioxygenase-like lactoylglutathione lyase family enzyme